jgi:hypothetical protein
MAPHNKRMQRTRQSVTHFCEAQNARHFAAPLMRGVMRHEPPIARPPEVFDLQRLRLRRPRASDAAAILECASDPEVARYADGQ